jgi:16S rRNA processing protein RimM
VDALELVAVGRILRPQGRRGEVRVEPLTDAPERLRDLAECYLVPPPEGEPRRVEAVRFQGPVPVVKLDGAETIGDAEALAGRLVAIPRAAMRPLPPDRFYELDLVGCAVRDPGGAELGTLVDVLGASDERWHDHWVVRAGHREWLVPAVSAIVERVDLAARVVVVRPPEGLVELD